MELGKKILKLRKRKNLTQLELGKYLGVGKSTISNYETGYSTPDIDTISKLAALYGVTTDYLLGQDIPETKIGVDMVVAEGTGLYEIEGSFKDSLEILKQAVADGVMTEDMATEAAKLVRQQIDLVIKSKK